PRVRRDHAGLPGLPRVEGQVDEARLEEVRGVDPAPAGRPAAAAREARGDRRDRDPHQLLQAAAGVRLSPSRLTSPWGHYQMTNESLQTTLVFGGGPAGLTAAYLLGKAGVDAVVLEADDQVGGLAKTVEVDGYRFDLGGHRFFTKAIEVDMLWHEILGEEFLLRPRMSRIYWNNRYLDYPLRGPDVIRKLGPIELTRCMASYLRAAARPNKVDDSLEDWVTNRFGRRLFELFFKTYNEKVWGAPASEIRAEWAAQRIRGLSFLSAARAAFFGNKGNKVKSLISEFNYPRYGPGQMWERMADAIVDQGGEVRLEAPVERIELVGGRVVEVEAGGELYELPDNVISSLPLREVVEMTHPHAPREVQDAARGLNYRDFLTVALVVDGEDLFPDNWIYIH